MAEPLTIEEIKDLVPVLYSDQFLAGLAKRFDFPPLAPEAVDEFRSVARHYLVINGEEPLRARASEYHREAMALLRTTEKFIEALKQAQEDDIAFEMFRLARSHRPPTDKFDIADLPEAQLEMRNNRHYEHLLGLSRLLAAAAQRQLDQFKLPQGRRKNAGLQWLVDYADIFWTGTLHRKFSIDYHQGSYLSRAYEFVEALVKPLDSSVTETQIITAMRAQVKSRNKELKGKAAAAVVAEAGE
jgi:hypothetical protein